MVEEGHTPDPNGVGQGNGSPTLDCMKLPGHVRAVRPLEVLGEFERRASGAANVALRSRRQVGTLECGRHGRVCVCSDEGPLLQGFGPAAAGARGPRPSPATPARQFSPFSWTSCPASLPMPAAFAP